MPDFAFRLPPIVELTITQQIALDEPGPLLATGGPGSGKTVVSIFRFLNDISQTRNALFFTYNRTLMSSIRGTLRQRAGVLLPDLTNEEVDEIVKSQIGSIYEWYGDKFYAALTNADEETISRNFSKYIQDRDGMLFSELIIDEAQDLRPEIINCSYRLAEKVSCGSDRSQDLQGHYTEPADDVIYRILNSHRQTLRQGLTQNFRNTRQIFEFARRFVPSDYNVQNIDIEELPEGNEPDWRFRLSREEQLAIIMEIVRQNPGSNIGIIVHFKSHVDRIRDFLIENGYSTSINAPEAASFSYYYSGMPKNDKIAMEMRLRTPFILTYESCKGLEFDIVIMPFMDAADWALTHVKKDESGAEEMDSRGNPKYFSTPSHYYVGATRGRSQLYILGSGIPGILSFIS
jgi:superfamily I DNA/RNA helicase